MDQEDDVPADVLDESQEDNHAKIVRSPVNVLEQHVVKPVGSQSQQVSEMKERLKKIMQEGGSQEHEDEEAEAEEEEEEDDANVPGDDEVSHDPTAFQGTQRIEHYISKDDEEDQEDEEEYNNEYGDEEAPQTLQTRNQMVENGTETREQEDLDAMLEGN